MQPNLLCPECLNIPLLGIKFSIDTKNNNQSLSNMCEIYSYCIYEHNEKKESNKVHKTSLDKINFVENNKTNINQIKCEKCKTKIIEYYCLECKRNICKDCFVNHNKHRYYYNKEYFSVKELNQIKEEYDKSRENLDKNLNLISIKIDEYDSKLKTLKKLYNDYKEINEKLKLLCDYLLKLYTDLMNKQEYIYYPIYFNIKNILLFNPIQISLIDTNNISIESFTSILKDKFISGFYNIIQNSNYSKNLYDYCNYEKQDINYDLLKLNNFNKKEVQYDKILQYDDIKFFGIYNDKKNSKYKTDIYNMKTNNIESSLNLLPEKVFYKENNNLLIILSKELLYIFNPKDFSIKQEISKNHKIKVESKKSSNNEWSGWRRKEIPEPKPGNFISASIISSNSFVILFEGDFRCLGEEYEKIIFSNTDGIKAINDENKCYINNKYGEYNYLILYEKNKDNFEPKKIIYLLRNEIRTNEVPYVTGKYCELDINEYEGNTYCSFKLNSIFKISENEFILSYESKIMADRDQGYYYITDKKYKNEILYYYLNIKKQNQIVQQIFSTEQKSIIYHNPKVDKFYFLYIDSECNRNTFSKFFNGKNLKFKTVKFTSDILNINSLFIHRNTIIISDNEFIYYGKIFGNEFEIINRVDAESLVFLSLEHKYIFYKKEKDRKNKTNKKKIDDRNNSDIRNFFKPKNNDRDYEDDDE